MKTIALALAALVLTPSVALADWQLTQLGIGARGVTGEVRIQCTTSNGPDVPVYLSVSDGLATRNVRSIEVVIRRGGQITFRETFDTNVWADEGIAHAALYQDAYSGEGERFISSLRRSDSVEIAWNDGSTRRFRTNGRGADNAVRSSMCGKFA